MFSDKLLDDIVEGAVDHWYRYEAWWMEEYQNDIWDIEYCESMYDTFYLPLLESYYAD